MRVRRAHALGLAGHGDRRIAEEIAILDDLRPAEQVPARATGERVFGGVEPAGADGAEIDDVATSLTRVPDRHEAGAAEPAHPRLASCQSEGGCTGAIERIA